MKSEIAYITRKPPSRHVKLVKPAIIIPRKKGGIMALKEVEVLIRFPNLDQEQRKHLYKAATQLSKAGIHFDTGAGCEGNDWEFDWSLKGASVYFYRFKEEN